MVGALPADCRACVERRALAEVKETPAECATVTTASKSYDIEQGLRKVD